MFHKKLLCFEIRKYIGLTQGPVRAGGSHSEWKEFGMFLAFNLLLILLSRIKALGGSWQVHEVTVFLRSQPTFYLIKNDPLGLEKVKAAHAVGEFLKV